MKLDNNILHIISKYLSRKETVEERAELYEWYEGLDKETKVEDLNILQARGKERLMREISGTYNSGRVVKLLSYKLAAACIAIAICSVSLLYYINRDQITPLKLTELEKLIPNHNRATITIGGGNIIELEKLANNSSIRTGNTIVKKDENGQLSYTVLHQDINGSAEQNLTSTLQTTKASQYTILLSDGTKVYLNEVSKLTYPESFGIGDRVVELSGEAYFEVTKTTQRSRFIVKTKGQAVEVLGTKFNINAYGDLPFVKTTLAQGSVRINPINKAITPILLKPNQQSVLGSKNVARLEVNADEFIAWKNGYFIFDGNNTNEIVAEIGKWYGIKIEYKHTAKPIEYTGKLPKNIGLVRLMELLNYSGIKVQAYKDKDDQYKLIIN
jgi:hypothetical protein